MLSTEEIRTLRAVPETERERRSGMRNIARTLAESIYRDLSVSLFALPERERWLEAKRLAKKRLFLDRVGAPIAFAPALAPMLQSPGRE